MMMWHACMKKQRNYHCLLMLFQKELFIKSNRTKESLYAKFNPALTFVPVDFADLSSQMTYNKCVTAFAQEPLDAAIQKISPELFDQYEIFKSREMLLEWSPKNVHKATGLAKLISHLGIDQSQVMACGDEANDLSMIEWAGLGVAMQNAVPGSQGSRKCGNSYDQR